MKRRPLPLAVWLAGITAAACFLFMAYEAVQDFKLPPPALKGK